MGGSLGPVLANIIMTKCEKVIVDKLTEGGIIKFYRRYVDGTLLVIRRTDISCVLNKFNSFNDNLKFTIDTFENCVPHFLDIEICPNGLGIYHKHTQDGQYVNFDSFTLRKWKVSWIRSLVTRADDTGGTRGHVPNGPASLLCLRRTIFFVYCRNISFVSAN